MRFLSVCSGIEAASVAWRPLGWEAVAFSEIEPFPCAVLAHHYPNVPNRGDMSKFQEWPSVPVDLLCGGTPCQSFSVAGLRKGLDDPRGNLMLTFGAIAARYRPRWLVWENVPGVLSSNEGRDFGAFLGLLGFLGYGFAYRVLDAQYFGVAQRRKRVFVVGCLGGWRSAAAVLFERHSLSGHPAPRRQPGQRAAATLDARAEGGGFPGTDGACGGHVVPTLTAQYGEQCGQDYMNGLMAFHWNAQPDQQNFNEHTTPTLTRSQEAAVALPLPFDTTQVTSKANVSNPKHGDPCHPLAAGAHAPAVALALRGREGGATAELGDEVGHALRASSGGGDKPHVLTAMQVRRLTPEECEALQGFPSGYTAISWRGKLASECPDGPRYKALGNSWAVPVARWIGQRIDALVTAESAIREAA